MSEGIRAENYKGQRVTAEQFRQGWQVSFLLGGRCVEYSGFNSAKMAIKFARNVIDQAARERQTVSAGHTGC